MCIDIFIDIHIYVSGYNISRSLIWLLWVIWQYYLWYNKATKEYFDLQSSLRTSLLRISSIYIYPVDKSSLDSSYDLLQSCHFWISNLWDDCAHQSCQRLSVGTDSVTLSSKASQISYLQCKLVTQLSPKVTQHRLCLIAL